MINSVYCADIVTNNTHVNLYHNIISVPLKLGRVKY